MSDAERTASTREAYDSVAVDFAERTVSRSDMAAEFFDRFVRSLPSGALVADLGCGPGHDAGRLIQAGHRPVGIDISTGLLALAPAATLTVQADLRYVPLCAASVDGIWSSAALLHVDSDDVADTFDEWNRILKPGAIVGLATSLASASEQNRGWEIVPAGPNRRPEIADGQQRWFAHHERSWLLDAIEAVGWKVTWSAVRSSHRDWLQLLAAKN